MELCYCGFYRRHVVVADYRDSMVSVHHEVGIPDLVELDGGQVLALLERSVYALPPLCHARPRGQEGSVEVPPSPHAADDLVDLNDPPPSVEAVVGNGKLSSDVVEGEQPVRGALPSDTGEDRSRRRARRLAREKSASTCSFRFMYGIIPCSLLKACLRNRF